MSGQPYDVLLRLTRWRTKLERNHNMDRETAARLSTVARACDEISELRRRIDRLQTERETLHAVMTGRPRGLR
jgi:hypothetical protein